MSASLSPSELMALTSLWQQLELARRQPMDGAFTGLFHVESIDLTKASGQLPTSGFGLVALKNGSHPGARLKLSVNGKTELRQWSPGSSFTGYFDGVTFQREEGCPITGELQVMVLDSPYAALVEADAKALKPVALLGSRTAGANAVYTFQAVTEDTDPAAATPNIAGAFDASGFTRIRVLIDGLTAAANFTTADLIPWSSPDYTAAIGGTWFEQGTERVSIPDSDTSGARFRVIVLNVTGAGFSYLSIRNLLAGARTGLGFYVEGVA